MSGGWLWLLLAVLPMPWLLRLWKPHKVSMIEAGITMMLSALAFGGLWAVGLHSQTADVEIWSGEVTNKKRIHDTYRESYECNCRTVTSGSGNNKTTTRKCDTCWRTKYTVTWNVYSNIGSTFQFGHLDSRSSSVYAAPDPHDYTLVQKADPVAVPHTYTNYIKAVPESIYNNLVVDQKYETMIPKYPSEVFDRYRINRVVTAGKVPMGDLKAWNEELELCQREMGPNKQANVVIVFADTNDSAYANSLERAWLGGKKNDVVVVIGAPNYPAVDFVRVFSWSKAEEFKIILRDRLMKFKEVDRPAMLETIRTTVLERFERRDLKDFDYLEDAVQPPLWAVIVALLSTLAIQIGATIFFSQRGVNITWQTLRPTNRHR